MKRFIGNLVTMTSTLILFVNRETVTRHGLWDQIRVDHGKKFNLTLFIHSKLRHHFGPRHVTAYYQTPSTQVNKQLFQKY